MTARDELDRALATLAEDGRQTPCQGKRRDRWTSDDHDEREWAAFHCRSMSCPVLDLCATVVLDEKPTFGVWAGIDRTKPTRKPRREDTT